MVNQPIAARTYFREQEGFGCHRFSGSEPRAGTLHLSVLRRRRRWRRREEGGEACVPGSSAMEKARQLSNRALLSSLHSVSVLCSSLCPEAFSALPVLLWQGHPGSAFERHYNWKNWSWSVKPAVHQQFVRRKRPI